MTKNLFEILIDCHSYLYKFYSKLLKIRWTVRLKMVLMVSKFHRNLFAGRLFALTFLGECICAKKKNTNKIREISGMCN